MAVLALLLLAGAATPRAARDWLRAFGLALALRSPL
jgi:hypothetical protein